MNDTSMRAHSALPAVATWLGRAGLLPFIGMTIAMGIDSRHRDLWAHGLAAYTLAIVSFLLGAWWGLALIRRYPSALILSNGLFLLLFFSYVLLDFRAFFIIGALLFFVILATERRHALFQLQPLYYARLRLYLSITAGSSLLLAAYLIA